MRSLLLFAMNFLGLSRLTRTEFVMLSPATTNHTDHYVWSLIQTERWRHFRSDSPLAPTVFFWMAAVPLRCV